MEKEIELFVPGRICLFGEHSDWAGGHRRQNPEIEKGFTIVAPTNQGIYARARKIQEPVFRFKSTLSNELFETELNTAKLIKEAEKGELFSYIAGVAHEIVAGHNNCRTNGIEIENYKTTLPIKKGLSSSASVCVLIAKAFKEVYGFDWTPRRIMDLAYFGETTTPSRCGRMDQACAYNKPVVMIFDGDKISVEELEVGEDIYLIAVSLKRGKNTVKILTDLSRGFPFPTNDIEKQIHDYLGPINKHIVLRAIESIKEGDVERLGKLMKEAQRKFDTYLKPACPEELEAPELHQILSLPEIQDFIYGGKGVGSGGDGAAQFVCKSKEDREMVRRILEARGYECFDLDLKKTEK